MKRDKIARSIALWLFILLVAILVFKIPVVNKSFSWGLEVAGRFSVELPLDELVDNFKIGLDKASRFSYSATQSFYKGFIVEEESITSDGDTIILHRQKNTQIRTVNTSWEGDSIVTKLKREGKWIPGHASQIAYIDTFQQFAIIEMLKHGIPASIKLAQGILESSSGKSWLCKNSNNHFGVKCRQNDKNNRYDWSPRENAIGCVQSSDDVPWDHFCVYKSAEWSYKAQSTVLMNKRYRRIFSFPVSDRLYKIEKGWYENTDKVPYYAAIAVELKRGGYATSDTYHYKISKIIDDLELWRIDFAVINARSG